MHYKFKYTVIVPFQESSACNRSLYFVCLSLSVCVCVSPVCRGRRWRRRRRRRHECQFGISFWTLNSIWLNNRSRCRFFIEPPPSNRKKNLKMKKKITILLNIQFLNLDGTHMVKIVSEFEFVFIYSFISFRLRWNKWHEMEHEEQWCALVPLYLFPHVWNTKTPSSTNVYMCLWS